MRFLICLLILAALTGCATQRITITEYYETTEETLHVREDNLKVGALKSETIKEGQPDWSGNKSFSLFSW